MLIQDGLRRVADAVRERLPELHDLMGARLRVATPSYPSSGNEQLGAAYSETITASLRDVLEYLADGRSAAIRVSNPTLREVRLAAQAGVELQVLLQGSRTAQATLWQFVLEEAHRLIPDATERMAVLRNASANHFAWNDAISVAIIEAFQQENTAYALQSSNRRRITVLRALLADLPVDTAVLDYPLSGSHLAAQVWGSAVPAAIDALAAATNSRPLAASLPDGVSWVWLRWPQRAGRPVDVLTAAELPPGACIAFGALGTGADGFRLSHRQAGDARAVAIALDRPLVWYDDVVLEAHALHDLAAVRAFIVDELTGLGDVLDPENALIQTLRTYFANGQNATLAAQQLGVHNRTVAYRLRSVESKVGNSVMRRDEFAVALRLAGLVTTLRKQIPDESAGYGLAEPAL